MIIDIIKMKEADGQSIYYDFENHRFENTYDILSLANVLEEYRDMSDEYAFICDSSELETCIRDFINNN